MMWSECEGRERGVVSRSLLPEMGLAIEQQDRRSLGGEHLSKRGLREQEPGLRIAKQEVESVAGVSRIEWEISGASLENGEDSDDHGEAAFEAESDSIVRLQVERAKMMGQSIGLLIELSVGERLLFEDKSGCTRSTLYLLLEEMMRAQISGIRSRRIVPALQN
jgi:hypothetical protein